MYQNIYKYDDMKRSEHRLCVLQLGGIFGPISCVRSRAKTLLCF